MARCPSQDQSDQSYLARAYRRSLVGLLQRRLRAGSIDSLLVPARPNTGALLADLLPKPMGPVASA